MTKRLCQNQLNTYIGFGGLFSKANLHRFWRAFFKSRFSKAVLAQPFLKVVYIVNNNYDYKERKKERRRNYTCQKR